MSGIDRVSCICRPGSLHGMVLRLALIALILVLPATAFAARNVHRIETPLGIKAWLVEERSIPLISMNFAFSGGAMQDPADRGGLVSLLAALLTEGAGELDAQAFARRMAEEGAQIAVTATRDQIAGSLDSLAARFTASAELLRLALAAPRFDADAFERARAQRIAELELAANEPRAVAHEHWHAATFPGHAYGRPPKGGVASLRAMTREEMRTLHKRLLARDNLRVVIVGDIDRASAIQAIDAMFGTLPAKAEITPIERPALAVLTGPLAIAKDVPLATSAFGRVSLRPDHADYPALKVLNHILGSGDFDSLLMDEIRVKRGLAYAAAISLTNDQSASLMLGGMATRADNMTPALAVLREVFRNIAAAGPSQQQVDNAKLYLTGSAVLDLDTNTKLADSLLRLWLEGKAPEDLTSRNDAIRRVRLEDVRRVARDMMAWEQFNIVVVGPAGKPEPK